MAIPQPARSIPGIRGWNAVQDTSRQKRDLAGAFSIPLPDGSVKYLEPATHRGSSSPGAPARVFTTHVDATERKLAQDAHDRLRQLESDLAHVNRVSVMGELAASLIHEITQPIASARNNARAAMHFLDRSPSDPGEVREALVELVADTDRVDKIIDLVRAHIKKAPPRRDHLDLNDTIKDVLMLARTAIVKNSVAVHTQFPAGPATVDGDCVQLQQVVLNLILNAIEAMSSVETGTRDLVIAVEHPLPDQVRVTVRDSGPGIDPKDRDRVFETFYTTKSGGTGMGLSISRSIVAAHGGRLWAEVNASRGAVFRFTLPGAAKHSGILPGRPARPQRRAKALQETRLVDGLSQVADDSLVEHAGSVGIVGIGCDEDRRDRVPRIGEVSAEIDPGHAGHLHVGNQAAGFGQVMGREEIGARAESLDREAERSHQPSHGLAKELVIIDDRNQ